MILPFPLSSVSRIVAYNRDELTTDLICLDVMTGRDDAAQTWTFHEQQPQFEEIVSELAALPGFLDEWREHVVKPPFAACETVLYSRPVS